MLQRPVAEAASRRPGRTGKTQLKLFNAAMDIMTQKGLEYATVEEVAARAGVSKGTVYYNFGSKKTMVDQLVQYGTQLLLSDARRAASVHSDPREALRSAIRAAFQYLEDRPGFTRMWLSEAWKGADGWTEAMSDNRLNLLWLAAIRLIPLRILVRLRSLCSARFTCLLWIVKCIRRSAMLRMQRVLSCWL